MFKPKEIMFVVLVVALSMIAPFATAQETKQSPTGSGQVDDSTHRAEREAMYYRYLEFASYVLTTIIVVPGCLTAASTASGVFRSSNPRRESSARMGAMNGSG